MSKSKISKEVIEEIKSRASLIDEVRKVVPSLKLKGRDWWGPCPFHDEKSASFHVREDQGYYHCFGCGAHGNVITFVQETRGGSFAETLEYLASSYGVQIKREAVDPVQEARRNDGLKALERAAKFYQRCLTGESAAYVAKRRLTTETIQEFGLGFSPDSWSGVLDALVSEQFKPETLDSAGLVIAKEGGRGYYDRFRKRVMFPIHNLKDEVVGFGGRVIDGGDPKYLNSPETQFFNKSYVLYNLNRARAAIRSEKKAVIVEGYMDAVALWQSGVKYAVAPLGTAITPDQVKLLWRFHEMPVCCLDGDEAGRNAAKRLAQRILPELTPGRSVKFMWMPDGEDPDSYVQKYGAEAFEAQLAKAEDLESVLWQVVLAEDAANVASADVRAAIEGRIGNITKEITNEMVRKHFYQGLKNRLWQSSRQGSGRAQPHPKVGEKNKRSILPQTDGMARTLLAIVVRYPQIFNAVQESFSQLKLESAEHKALHQSLLKKMIVGGVENCDVETYLEASGLKEVANALCTATFVDQLLEGHDAQQVQVMWQDRFREWKDRNKAKSVKSQNLEEAQSWEEMRKRWNAMRSRRTQAPS